jgi:hypothetical protein
MAVKEREWQPTEEQAKHLIAFTKNGQHYLNQLNSLVEKYGGRFVAVFKEEVVFDAKDQITLFEGLKKKYGAIPPDIYIAYVQDEHEIMIA